MHEHKITEYLVKVALEEAELCGDERIERLYIDIDPNTGYAADSIRFYFEQIAIDTPAAGAELVFQFVPHPHQVRLTSMEIGYKPAEDGEDGSGNCVG